MDSKGYVFFTEEWLRTMANDLDELDGLIAKIVGQNGYVSPSDLAYIRDNFRQARWPAAREVIIKRARMKAVNDSYEQMMRAANAMWESKDSDSYLAAAQALRNEVMNLNAALMSDPTLSPDALAADERIGKA